MTDVIWIGHDRNEVRRGAELLASAAENSGHIGSKAVFMGTIERNATPFCGLTRIGHDASFTSLPKLYDYGIILDDDIIGTIDIPVFEDGILFVNTSKNDRCFDSRFHTITIDGSFLAQSIIFNSDPHVAMLGAFNAVSNLIRYDQSIKAISRNMHYGVEKLITLFALSYGAVLSGRSI